VTSQDENAIAGLPQRFAMLSLEWQLSGSGDDNMIATRNVHECFWSGVICDGISVRGLEWGSQGFSGGNLGTELGILTSLEYLDVSNNGIAGTIPEQLYGLVSLTDVYLYKNEITGPISSNVWQSLAIVHLACQSQSIDGKHPGDDSVGGCHSAIA
jgi:hypothetical protein